MSQEKVDRRKYEKANRQKIEAQKRLRKRLSQAVAVVICAAIVVFIGFSVYDSTKRNTTVSTTKVNVDAISDFSSSVASD